MKCLVCGETIKFRKQPNGETESEVSARADHYATHNPSPADWTVAYEKIQEGKERSKKGEK
jgi:hypothetical protein